jgi:hypothetical protein
MYLYSIEFHGYEEDDIYLLTHENEFTQDEFDNLVAEVSKKEWEKIVFNTDFKHNGIASAEDLCIAVQLELIATKGFKGVTPVGHAFSTRDYHKMTFHDGRIQVRTFDKRETIVYV